MQTPKDNRFNGCTPGYVPRLARHEDFGRIFEGVGSTSAESVHARDWSKRHQSRRGAYMATPADRMHTATGSGARWSNQQCGRGVYAWCLWPTMQYWGFLEGARDFKASSSEKEHTNQVQSGSRDPGVSRPAAGLGQSPTCSKLIPCVFTYIFLF